MMTFLHNRVDWKFRQLQQVFDTQTVTKLFQRAVGIPETGSLTPLAFEMLNSSDPDNLLRRVCLMAQALVNQRQGNEEDHLNWTSKVQQLEVADDALPLSQ
jgi:hypothetical protein